MGIRSTALLFGENTLPILSAFSATSLSCVALSGYLNDQGLPFYLGVGMAGIRLAKVDLFGLAIRFYSDMLLLDPPEYQMGCSRELLEGVC